MAFAHTALVPVQTGFVGANPEKRAASEAYGSPTVGGHVSLRR
jgi:hypothetical protein